MEETERQKRQIGILKDTLEHKEAIIRRIREQVEIHHDAWQEMKRQRDQALATNVMLREQRDDLSEWLTDLGYEPERIQRRIDAVGANHPEAVNPKAHEKPEKERVNGGSNGKG